MPSGCELVVGGEPQCWSEGSCLLFDDSFLHTAFHDGKRDSKGCAEAVVKSTFIKLIINICIYDLMMTC